MKDPLPLRALGVAAVCMRVTRQVLREPLLRVHPSRVYGLLTEEQSLRIHQQILGMLRPPARGAKVGLECLCTQNLEADRRIMTDTGMEVQKTTESNCEDRPATSTAFLVVGALCQFYWVGLENFLSVTVSESVVQSLCAQKFLCWWPASGG